MGLFPCDRTRLNSAAIIKICFKKNEEKTLDLPYLDPCKGLVQTSPWFKPGL